MTEDDRTLKVADPATNSSDAGQDVTGAHGSNGNGASASAAQREFIEPFLMLPFTEARARALELFDREFLTAALARNSGNIARTARSLGLHRQSLQKLMTRRGLKSGRVPAGAATATAKDDVPE